MTLHLTTKVYDRDVTFGPTIGRITSVVAHDEGLFAEEDLEVTYVKQEGDWRRRPAGETDVGEVDIYSRHYFYDESEEPQVFNACEWGNLVRSYESKRGARALSRIVGPDNQAIIVAPDSPYVHARELAGKPVAVRFHSGSHYSALEALEGFLRRDEINLVNHTHADGWEGVKSGELAAVTLMEPWITLARKQGFHVLAEVASTGIELGAPDIDPAAYAAYNRARTKAAARINADKATYFERYYDYIVSALPPEYRELLTLEDLYLDKFHFRGPLPYRREDFQRTYDWLVSWGLIADDATYERLVNPQVALVS